MKYFFVVLFLLPGLCQAQELFSYTEPASNMAAKSIGIRINTMFGKDFEGKSMTTLNPEIMFGLSSKIMVHTNVYFSNNTTDQATSKFDYNGAGVSLKYRFYSEDEVHSHFRMAGFAKAAYSNVDLAQAAINLNGNNTGYEVGVVATKLINKVAFSTTAGYVRTALKKGSLSNFNDNNNDAFEYTLSLGKLMLPSEYTDYDQTNVNLMIEMLGQYNFGMRAGYVDLGPSIQMIIKSRMRVDAGYRFPIAGGLFRTMPRSFLVRFEYNIFNAYK